MYVLFFKFFKYNSARPFLCIRDYSLYALKLAIIALIRMQSLFFISRTLMQSVFKSSEWGSFLGQGARPLNHPWLGFSPYSLVCPYGSTPMYICRSDVLSQFSKWHLSSCAWHEQDNHLHGLLQPIVFLHPPSSVWLSFWSEFFCLIPWLDPMEFCHCYL